MILVDSCVWIDLLRGKASPQTRFLESLAVSSQSEICLNRVIYFEVLRGIISDLERRQVRKHFDGLVMIDEKSGGFDALVELSLLCRRQGLNLPRLGDWLILKTVLDHDLELLTSDRDFYAIRRIRSFGLVGE